MDLKFIKTDKCPECDCDVVCRERVETDRGKIRTHCNGGHWETREFACGYTVQYVPNYMKEEVLHACNSDLKVLLRQYRIGTLKKELINTINKSELDEKDKTRFINAIEWS